MSGHGWPLTPDGLAPLPARIRAQLSKIGEELERRVDELGRATATTIRRSVAFYSEVSAVSDDELLTSCTENLRFFCMCLKDGDSLDTSAAVKLGTIRASGGVPLPAVMDAYRVGLHHVWRTISEVANRPGSGVGGDALMAATERVWQAQDLFTTTMAGAYRQQSMQEVLEDEAERAALTEALLEGRIFEDRTVWDIAQLLRIPRRGPYLVIAAEVPTVGKQPLRGIASKLSSVDVSSAWRLLPDLQVGIAYISSKNTRDATLRLLRRVAVTPVGVSPVFDNLTETAQALRYARFALNARDPSGAKVVVFDDSALGIAAVSAPEAATKIETIVFAGFQDLSAENKGGLFTTFQSWVDHSGSVPDTAEALRIHPNTVRYRLRRIEQVSGRSLKVPRDLAELCLAIEVHQRLPRQHG